MDLYGSGYAPLKIEILPLYRIEEFAPEGLLDLAHRIGEFLPQQNRKIRLSALSLHRCQSQCKRVPCSVGDYLGWAAVWQNAPLLEWSLILIDRMR
jgi:hypothetical protein